MDDSQWRSCDDPRKMLERLRGKASDRKLRLFACAFWRRWWDADAEGQEEEEADVDVLSLLAYAEEWAESAQRPTRTFSLGFGWHPLVAQHAFDAANWTIRETTGSKSRIDCLRRDDRDREQAAEEQTRLLKELFGETLREVVVDPLWLTSAVVNLARAVYEDRRCRDMPILADALEDAGCSQQDVIRHCRGAAEHVKGCWVVDLLLGRE
jgi:hypothetical protein